jgi:hypothetical protein
VVAAVKEFREQNGAWHPGVNLREQLAAEQAKAMEAGEELQNDSVNLRLATGNVGVMAAINDTVRAVEHNILLMLYAAVFVMCLISFRSIFAAFCIVLPLVLVTELGHSLMVKLGTRHEDQHPHRGGAGRGHRRGLRDLHLCPHARGDAVGQDPLTESYFIALKTTGIAIFYTALTLAVGVAMGVLRAQVPGRHGPDADLHVRGQHVRGADFPAGPVPLAAASDREGQLDAGGVIRA